MKKEHQIIIDRLTEYLTLHPPIRFGQALYNLNINQFADQQDPANKDFLLRDIHCDSDEAIVKRLNEAI